MAEFEQVPTPTQSVLLELREERAVVQEGYRFLDEKRLLLAAEILRQLEHYQRLQKTYLELHDHAGTALRRAVSRHGLEGLQVYPPVDHLAEAELSRETRTFLGVPLARGGLIGERPTRAASAVDPSPEARACSGLFRELVERGAELAAVTGNLERLLDEYQRTERRARALEDVLLPEVERQLKEVQTRLEDLDQEEAIRTRLKR